MSESFRILLPFLLAPATLAGCALGEPAGPSPSPAAAAPAISLGTYDPRAVALAYYRSAAHRAHVDEAAREHARLLAAGDADGARRIESEMAALQDRAHRQGFGGDPVPELVEKVRDRLPELARAAGVQAIVSARDFAWREPGAETTDVSLPMAQAFEPDDETLRIVREALRRAPAQLGPDAARRDF